MTQPGNVYPEINEPTLAEEHLARVEESLEMERIKNSHMEAELAEVKKQLSEKILENQILGALDMEELNRTNVESLKAAQLQTATLKKKTEELEKKLANTEKDGAAKLKNLEASLEMEKQKSMQLEKDLCEIKKQLEDATSEEKYLSLVEASKKAGEEIDNLMTELLNKTELEEKAKKEKEALQIKVSNLEHAITSVLDERAENEKIWRRKETQLAGLTNRNALLEDRLKSTAQKHGEEMEELHENAVQLQTTIITLARLLAKCSFKRGESSDGLSIATDAPSPPTSEPLSDGTQPGLTTLSRCPTMEAIDHIGPSNSARAPAEYLGTLCTLCTWGFLPEQEIIKCVNCGTEVHKECALDNKNKKKKVSCSGCGKRLNFTAENHTNQSI